MQEENSELLGGALKPGPVLRPFLIVLAALLRLLFFVVVNRNRIQILCLKYLTAIETTNVIDTVPAVEEFGSLVLTTLHSEITPILV